MNIKKKLRIIIPCAVILVGIIMIVTGLAKGALSDYKNTLELTGFEANIPSGSIYNLDVDVSLADINVICTNEVDDFNIKAENITKDFIEYTTSNNTLRLRYATQKWYQAIFIPGYHENKGKIDLYIPADIKLRDVEITAGYGELSVSYLTAERAFLSCKNGDNHIKNLTCDYAEINNDGANINGVNIEAKNADLNLVSDMAVFSNFTTESLILNNDGDLKLSGMINGDSSFKSDGGDVNITLYSDDFDYEFKVIEGDVEVDGNNSKSDDKEPCKMEVKGNINFKIN